METTINQEKISQYLSIIKTNIENDNIKCYYNINRKMEDIVAKLLELVYGYTFINTNDIYPNYPAIDLADKKRRIAVQVTYEQIIDDDCMEYYYYEYEKKNFSDDLTEIILRFCDNNLKLYGQLKEIYEKRTKKTIQERVYIDYDKIRKESKEYFFSKLFNKSEFLSLIEELKNEMPSKKVIIKELQENRFYNKLDLNPKYQYTVNFLIWQFKDEDEITEESFKNWDWEYFILSEVYEIIIEDKGSIEVNEQQKEIIQNICNNKILNVDFRNAIKYKKDKSWTTNLLCIYLWFYRYKFNFKYPDKILLDMLEFEFCIDGQSVGIDYIEKQVNKIEVRNRIVENINKRKIHTDVFKNHIQYCIKYNIGNCINAVAKHLISLMMKLKGNLNVIFVYQNIKKTFHIHIKKSMYMKC